MQVILLDKIRNLGNLGDTVKVKSGYARNYLIPQGKAVFANKDNIELFEQRRAEHEEKAKLQLEKAQARAEKINEVTLVLEAMASEEGKLYGSVGPNEISHALKQQNVDIVKREINMIDGPIHNVGEYTIDALLHSDVTASFKLEVVALAK